MRFWNRINWQWIKDRLHKCWRKTQAFLRLSQQAVCEESHGLGLIDYHDYPDSVEGEPWHFCVLTCKYCGKEFTI
jgi:hypothetical protein